MSIKPKIAVHKFSSCDGCQLAFLNLGEDLLVLSKLVDIVHFAEAGFLDDQTRTHIAFVEGSIATDEDLQRIRTIRSNTDFLITMGACATSGGLQALRNMADADEWMSAIYARPDVIDSLHKTTPIHEHVRVDFELWGCPVNSRQVLAAVRALLSGVMPVQETGKVCMECKRRQAVCVLVTRNAPCLGAVTRSGCGALCPAFGRDCFGCYGPSESPNTHALGRYFEGFGLIPGDVTRRFHFIYSHAPEFADDGGESS